MTDNTTMTAGFERMKMPAIDFKTYAREGNPHLGDGNVYPNHVIIFTGAAGNKRDVVTTLHHEILSAGGMPDPERANSQLFTFRSLKASPYVAGVIVPRDQLDTCMRWADIEEVPNMVSLQGKLAQATKARANEFAEVHEDAQRLAKAQEDAAKTANVATVGSDFLSRLFNRIDGERHKPEPVERTH